MATIDMAVTRHKALLELAVERGLLEPEVKVVKHLDVSTPEAYAATVQLLQGKHVFGVLPLDLAVHAASVTIIPLALRPEDRGKELNLDETRERAGETQVLKVTRL